MENLVPNAVPYFQLYSGAHFYTNAEAEYNTLINGPYFNQGIAFYCYSTNPPAGSIRFHRMEKGSTGIHFYTALEAEYQKALEEGFHEEGIPAYVYATKVAGTVPLYSLYKANDNYYTTSETEKAAALASGYSLRGTTGIDCYVYPPEKIPVYRFLFANNYLYTPSAIEAISLIEAKNGKATYQGIAFAIFPTQVTGTVPLTSMYKKPDHCFATSPADIKSAESNGYALQAGIGYVYASAQGSTEPALYELKNATGYFYTTSAVERDLFINGGFVLQGIKGYVMVGDFSTTLTTDQIDKNLVKMRQFNTDMNTNGNGMFTALDEKMSGPSVGDPGLMMALKLAEAGFSKIGSLAGPIGSAAASIFNGLLQAWATSTPPSVNQPGSPIERFDNTCTELGATLLFLQNDIYGSWNFPFEFQGKVTTLKELATSDLLKDLNAYTKLLDSSKHVLKLEIWKQYLVANYRIGRHWSTQWGDSQTGNITGEVQTDIAARPALYCTWKFDRFLPTWKISNVVIYKSGNIDLPTAACKYLFIDSTDGEVINANGLYHRKDVFTALGIPADD